MNQENNTFFVGKVLHHFEELPSTNVFASELVTKSKPSEGTVVSTDFQNAGRGQMGNTWESAAAQNITLSIILYPRFLQATQQFALNQVISLGVLDCLATFQSKGLSIKWSNDIYVHSKKISGILIQNTLKGSSIQTSIVGIGININQSIFQSDAPNPTSLLLENGKIYALDTIKARLYACIEQWYLRLRSGQIAPINKAYLSKMYRLNQKSLFERADGGRFEGKIVGLSPIGKLLIQTSKGVERFGFKEIKYIHT